MRCIMGLFWALVLFWAGTGGLNAQEGKETSLPAPGAPWPNLVEGFGLTYESAQQDAVKAAVREFADYLVRLQPPLRDWKPSEEYVRKNLIRGRGGPGPDVKIHDQQEGKSWLIPLKTPDLDELVALNHQAQVLRKQQERQALSSERLMLGLRVLGVFLGAMGTVFVYKRIKEKRTEKVNKPLLGDHKSLNPM
jgi:hypothetical protein